MPFTIGSLVFRYSDGTCQIETEIFFEEIPMDQQRFLSTIHFALIRLPAVENPPEVAPAPQLCAFRTQLPYTPPQPLLSIN